MPWGKEGSGINAIMVLHNAPGLSKPQYMMAQRERKENYEIVASLEEK